MALHAGHDPELIALPAPPRVLRWTTLVVMAAVVASALGLAFSVRRDVGYFFSDDRARVLGAALAIDPAALESNTYVQLEGSPMLATSVRYRRMLGSSYYVVTPLAGQRDIYVQLAYDDRQQERMATRREFAGRLVRFGDLGARFRNVRRFLEEQMQQPVSADSYVLLVDEAPSGYGWSLALVFFAILIALVDAWLLLRWFRPLPAEPDPEDEDEWSDLEADAF